MAEGGKFEILQGPQGQVVIKSDGTPFVPLVHYLETLKLDTSILNTRDVVECKIHNMEICKHMRTHRPDIVHPLAGQYRFMKVDDLIRLWPKVKQCDPWIMRSFYGKKAEEEEGVDFEIVDGPEGQAVIAHDDVYFVPLNHYADRMRLTGKQIKAVKNNWIPHPDMARFVRKHRPDISNTKNPNNACFVSLVKLLQALRRTKLDDPWLFQLVHNNVSPPLRKRPREEIEEVPFMQELKGFLREEMRTIVREEMKRVITDEYEEEVRKECKREIMDEQRYRLFSLMDQLQNAWPLK